MALRDDIEPLNAAGCPDDADLAVRAADGCTASFAVLAARHQVAIVHYLRQLLSRRGGRRAGCDAEDVAQETFLRAWRGLAGYDPRQPFAPWLFTIGRRTCLNHLRGERRHARRLARAALGRPAADDNAAVVREGPGLDASPDSLWGLAARTLSERQFTALWLRYVEEMPAAAIARVLASTTVGARLTLMRGRRRLEAALQEAGRRDGVGRVPAAALGPLLHPVPPPTS